MALYHKRILAESFRKEGKSINWISKKLGVSKSSVSSWCRNIFLSKKQIDELIKDRNLKTSKGRLIGAEMNRQKKLNSISETERFGKSFVKNLSNRELIILSTALYWAEGSKSDRTFGFQFINSDPEMIIVISKFLRIMNVKDDDILCKIQINEIHKPRIENVLKFWKNLLNLHDNQIGNTSFIKTKVKKVYSNYDNYYGICRLSVRKSTVLKYKLLGLIKAIKSDILSR